MSFLFLIQSLHIVWISYEVCNGILLCHCIQVCNFLVGLFFLDMVEKFGVAPVYGTFGGVSLLAAIFSTFSIVETKGLSLEEIEMSLGSDFISRDKK